MKDEAVVYICPNLECGCELLEEAINSIPMRCPECGQIMVKKVHVYDKEEMKAK